MDDHRLPKSAVWLGVAGLFPQLVALWLTLRPEDRFIGLAAGYFYAALIFSFLGGIWWGIGVTRHDAPKWIFAVAVVPSLIAFFSGVPWMTGAPWPAPSLIVLGLCLFASPLVDWRLFNLGLIGRNVLKLRMILSGALGVLTVLLGTR
jgi:hypothetical protein